MLYKKQKVKNGNIYSRIVLDINTLQERKCGVCKYSRVCDLFICNNKIAKDTLKVRDICNAANTLLRKNYTRDGILVYVQFPY